MFDSLSGKLTGIFERLTRRGLLTEADVDAGRHQLGPFDEAARAMDGTARIERAPLGNFGEPWHGAIDLD